MKLLGPREKIAENYSICKILVKTLRKLGLERASLGIPVRYKVLLISRK